MLGRLRLADKRPGAAARAFLYAYESAPNAPEAPRRLRAAASARETAHDLRGADALWQRLADEHPDQRADALLARGELALGGADATEALRLFDEAAHAAPNTPQASAARLGMSTCLERLGDLEGALAEIDASDLPPDVHDRRAEAVRARIAVGGQL
jgi:TolA-binding protein